MKILVLKTFKQANFDMFFPDDVCDKLAELGQVLYVDYDKSAEAKQRLISMLEDVDIVITGWGMNNFDGELLAAAPKLKIIAHTGGSVADLVSPEMENREELVILSGNRFFAESVAEATICYMLIGQRKLYPVLKETEQAGWFTQRKTAGLRGKTIGLVSFGMIAQYTAKMLRPYDVKVQVYSSHGLSEAEKQEYGIEECSLEELFSTSDIISVHSGLTEKTYHMIDKHLLSMMKDDALIVNTARGAVIDEAALIEELASGRIRAVLDVFEKEPLPMDSGLRGLDNATIVPHRGGPTTDVGRLVTLGLIEDMKRYGKQFPLENQISLDYAKRMTSHAVVKKVKEGQVVPKS